jgi:fumarate reductase flavoprotein subunit
MSTPDTSCNTPAVDSLRTPLSKRDFLKVAGAAAAALGLGETALAADARPWDLVVVGGGNAGLPTALFAAQRGARVLIVEAAAALGGTLFLSSGQMSAAGTKLQELRGIADSPQSHYDDVMRISRNTADPVLLRLAVDNAAPTFDWLMDHGFKPLDGQPITGTTHEPYSHERYVWAKDGGRAILKVLNDQLKPHIDAGRITVMTQTQVIELIQDRAGAIAGVVTRTDAGQTARQMARNVALTCGGYTENAAMYEKYEGAKDYTISTWPFSKGAGIDLGLAAGGYVRGGQNHTPLFGAVLADDKVPSRIRAMVRHFPGDRPPYEIFVDAGGKRFLCEDVLSHDVYEQALARQPGERCWMVFDDAALKTAPPAVRGGINAAWSQQNTLDAFEKGNVPMFHRGDTIGGLAKKAGVDAGGLAETIAAYNRAQAGGKDPLGRKFMPLPIAKAPFYAVQLRSWNLTSYGGLAVDGKLRVVRKDGTPIRNLYAAGELLGMGQLMGKAVCGGMSVTPALSLGRLLGNEILRFEA